MKYWPNFCCVHPLQFGTNGMHIVTLLVWLGAKMAATRKQFEFSLRSASNEHYIEQNESSTPTLPTINDICCKSGIQVTTMVVLLCAAVSGHKSKGWLKNSNRVQIALECRHSGHRVSCIHGARETTRHCVHSRPWLQSLILLTTATASARALLSQAHHIML